MIIKKTKTNNYLKAEKNVILERLDKKFKEHEQIELKIIEHANGLKNGQNKLEDYIAMQKLIDKQLMFLSELSEITDPKSDDKIQTPIFGTIIKFLKEIFKRSP